MDFKEIQELIKLFGKSDLADLKIEQDDFKIRLRKPEAVSQNNNNSPTVITQPVHQQQAEPVHAAPQSSSEAGGTQSKTDEKPAVDDTEGLVTIKSPMIGTFYRASAPDKDAFVKVGDDISKGTVLCIIEAMKLFNEIESEVEGKLVKVLVEDASPVEYDQPLFLVEPIKK